MPKAILKRNVRTATRQAGSTTDALIKRIDTLTATARTTWFTMLGFFAFVGVTLMGVKDADFFIVKTETALPLVGVSIPTFLFFWIGPLLGASLFAYFHLHLLKLYESLGNALREVDGETLSEKISPWLVTDLALNSRKGALRKRPMNGLALAVALLLAYLAMPIVLGVMWWRSMPAHEEWLTIIGCGIPLFVSVYAGIVSWGYMRQCISDRERLPRRDLRLGLGLIGVILLSVVGWFRTEQPLEFYAAKYIAISDDPLEAPWWTKRSYPWALARADLYRVSFSGMAPDRQDRAAAELEFRRGWCKDQGIPTQACYLPRYGDEAEREFIIARQAEWCDKNLTDRTNGDCFDIFTRFDGQQTRAWEAFRSAEINALNSVSLAGRDLRYADLREVQMQGVDLADARLDSADLWGARLEEASLWRAQMQGTGLGAAWLEKAVFSGANLDGATLQNSRMQGALLYSASLNGTNLVGADLEAATLVSVDMRGASFFKARLDRAEISDIELDEHTNLRAYNRQASFSGIDFSKTGLGQSWFDAMFGGRFVTLPEGIDRPAHWPKDDLSTRAYWSVWQHWIASGRYKTLEWGLD